MEAEQMTRGLLVEELRRERRACDRATILLRAAEYAFSHLPFDHAARKAVLQQIRTELHLPASGSPASAHYVLTEAAAVHPSVAGQEAD